MDGPEEEGSEETHAGIWACDLGAPTEAECEQHMLMHMNYRE